MSTLNTGSPTDIKWLISLIKKYAKNGGTVASKVSQYSFYDTALVNLMGDIGWDGSTVTFEGVPGKTVQIYSPNWAVSLRCGTGNYLNVESYVPGVTSGFQLSTIGGNLTPIDAKDIATKKYVDDTATGGSITGSGTSGKIVKWSGTHAVTDASNTDSEVASAVSNSHAKSHALNSATDHSSAITIDYMMKADANGLPVQSLYEYSVAGAVSQSHTRTHSIISPYDHVSYATPGYILKADANGMPITAANTDAQVASMVSGNFSGNSSFRIPVGVNKY